MQFFQHKVFIPSGKILIHPIHLYIVHTTPSNSTGTIGTNSRLPAMFYFYVLNSEIDYFSVDLLFVLRGSSLKQYQTKMGKGEVDLTPFLVIIISLLIDRYDV